MYKSQHISCLLEEEEEEEEEDVIIIMRLLFPFCRVDVLLSLLLYLTATARISLPLREIELVHPTQEFVA